VYVAQVSEVGQSPLFRSSTRSVCPQCLRVVNARIFIDKGKVILEKTCAEHGLFRALLSSDAEMYLGSLPYNKPGRRPFGYSENVNKGCPLDCGLCPDHEQHTCLGLIEVNSQCNLDCPICFAESQVAFSLSISQVGRMLDRFVALEGSPEVVQFSGGEPTLHPDILSMVRLAQSKGIKVVMLNTNGLRIAEDDRFLAKLADVRPIIYLQFDGFESATYEAIRGRDLLSLKLKALERMVQAKLDVVLVPTIEKGLNHQEIGKIVRFGIQHPAVRGISFQTVTHAGRYRFFDPMDRETIADVIHAIASQSEGALLETDFVPIPCCHPTCRYATYLFLDRGKMVPLPRVVPVEKYLDYVTNRTFPDARPEILKALEGLWSASSVPGTKLTFERVWQACCELPFLTRTAFLKDRVFQIVVQDFADAYTMDLDVLRKCCIGELIPDGRIIPFCAYSSLGYRQKIRAALRRGEMQ
jgi:uncharacterized radical SAM superfamily Fe-S cluster-containing enzyme